MRKLRMENLLLQKFDKYNSYSAHTSTVTTVLGSDDSGRLARPQEDHGVHSHKGMDALAHAFAFCSYDIHLWRRQDASEGVEIEEDVKSDRFSLGDVGERSSIMRRRTLSEDRKSVV